MKGFFLLWKINLSLLRTKQGELCNKKEQVFCKEHENLLQLTFHRKLTNMDTSYLSLRL